MRAEGITESSVLLFRQSSALTFLLNKIKNIKRSTRPLYFIIFLTKLFTEIEIIKVYPSIIV